MRRYAVLLVALLVGLLALPAGATVHEITGMECSSGNAKFDPPGLTGGSNEKANNFAKPLLATGVVEVEFDEAGQLVSLEWIDHPASKVVPGFGLPPVFDHSLPYANCKALRNP